MWLRAPVVDHREGGPPRRNTQGTPQGGVISPLLANIYLNVFPAKKSVLRERQQLRMKTSTQLCFVPIPELIEGLNRHLAGWSKYFSYGYPRMAMRNINHYVRLRLICHLKRRSQRSYRPPKGVSFYQHLSNLGLIRL